MLPILLSSALVLMIRRDRVGIAIAIGGLLVVMGFALLYELSPRYRKSWEPSVQKDERYLARWHRMTSMPLLGKTIRVLDQLGGGLAQREADVRSRRLGTSDDESFDH